MYCAGCSVFSGMSNLPTPWFCASCTASQPVRVLYCSHCAYLLKQGPVAICSNCTQSAPFPRLPHFPPLTPASIVGAKIITTKNRPSNPDLEFKIGNKIPEFLELSQERCKRPGCGGQLVADEGQTRTGLHRQLCASCLEEWNYASNWHSWPKGWAVLNGDSRILDKAMEKTKIRFMATKPGAFHPLMQRPYLAKGETCPWCDAQVKERPLFQSIFVGCLC